MEVKTSTVGGQSWAGQMHVGIQGFSAPISGAYAWNVQIGINGALTVGTVAAV